MKCLLLDIEMPIGSECPAVYNDEGLICYEGCGLADNPELINEKAENWEKLKRGELKMDDKKGDKNDEKSI